MMVERDNQKKTWNRHDGELCNLARAVIQQGRIPLGGDPIWHALTKKESENKEK